MQTKQEIDDALYRQISVVNNKYDRRHLSYLKNEFPVHSIRQGIFHMPQSIDPLLPIMADSTPKDSKRKRVLIVGAGAAGKLHQYQLRIITERPVGMSCAQQLSEHPDKFDVTLVEAVGYCGGQAFSIPLDKEKHGASWMNQGVQGGSYIFHHTMAMFARQGYHADPVKLQVSFGKDDTFWTNVFPTKLLAEHQKEIARFNNMLKLVRWFELFFALLPIKLLTKLFRFSDIFANSVALPMVALFLGTGNYTPEVPTIMLERLCTSPTYGMWYPPDKQSLASNLPPMVVFPSFSNFYSDWKKSLESKGVHVRLNTEVTEVLKRDKKGVIVKIIRRQPTEDGHNSASAAATEDPSSNANDDSQEMQEEYDEIVLCVL
jgi:hypothetical protein